MADNQELKQTSAWLPPDLYARLREAAYKEDVSQSQIIRDALEAHLSKLEAERDR